MTRTEKEQLVANLTEKLESVDHFYIADTSGFTVAEVNKFRKMCFDKEVEYKIVKNTLIKKALSNLEGDFSDFDAILKGTSGIMMVNERGNIPAKIIQAFQKEDAEQRPSFKAASIDSELYIGAEHLSNLSDLKSKEELIGEIIALLQSPAKNIVSLLKSGEQKIAGIIKTLTEK